MDQGHKKIPTYGEITSLFHQPVFLKAKLMSKLIQLQTYLALAAVVELWWKQGCWEILLDSQKGNKGAASSVRNFYSQNLLLVTLILVTVILFPKIDSFSWTTSFHDEIISELTQLQSYSSQGIVFIYRLHWFLKDLYFSRNSSSQHCARSVLCPRRPVNLVGVHFSFDQASSLIFPTCFLNLAYHTIYLIINSTIP